MKQNVTGKSSELSDRQLLALPYLTTSKSQTEAAESAGISRMTLHRWLNEPAFRETYQRQREEAAALATTEIRALMLKAAVVLAERLDSDNPEERARASRDVMTYGLKVADAEANRKAVERLNRLISNVEKEDDYHARHPDVPRTRHSNSLRR